MVPGRRATAEAQFVTLTAEIAAPKTAAAGNRKGGNDTKANDGKKGQRKKGDKKPAWRGVPPNNNVPITKKVDKKSYMWCPHHHYWGLHQASDCFKKNGISKKVDANSLGSAKALQLTAGHHHIMNDESE
jgi:hypothetical protein